MISLCIAVLLFILVSLFASCSTGSVGPYPQRGKACLGFDLSAGILPTDPAAPDSVRNPDLEPAMVLPAITPAPQP